jgi:hypothetical protein
MYEMAPDQLDRYRRAVADGRTGADLTAVEFLRASRPLRRWLDDNVGPSSVSR